MRRTAYTAPARGSGAAFTLPLGKGALGLSGSAKQTLYKQMGLFLGLTFGIAWLGFFTAWGCGQAYGGANFDIVLTIAWLAPGGAMLLCRKSEGTGFDPDSLGLKPHFKGNVRSYLFAYIFPTVLALLTGLLFFAAFPQNYDPRAESFLAGLAEGGLTQEQASSMLNSLIGMGVLAGPLVNILLSLTEVLGFFGWLLPKSIGLFDKNAPLKAALAVSGVWAVWHAPLFFDGYLYGRDYPGFPFAGLGLGLAFYFLLGLVLSYMALRTGSVIPAALSRSGVTAMAVTGVYFTKGETLLVVGPSVYGAFGCLALLVFAALFLLRIRRMDRAGKLWQRDGSVNAAPNPRQRDVASNPRGTKV